MVALIASGISRPSWERIYRAAERPPIEQSWAYGQALETAYRRKVERVIALSGDDEIGVAQLCTWLQVGPFGLTTVTRGPVMSAAAGTRELESAMMKEMASRYRKWEGRFLMLSPEHADRDEATSMLASIGLRRVITGYTTSWLDLRPEASAIRNGMDHGWRDGLRQGEARVKRVVIENGGWNLRWLVDRHESERKARKLSMPAGALVSALVDSLPRKQDALVATAIEGGEPIASVLVIRHGRAATYFASHSNAEGRKRRAHHVLLWRAIERLREDGVAWLDLGGLDGKTMSGVTRFKLGLGGSVVTLTGSYM